MTDDIYEENLDAFNRLLNLKENGKHSLGSFHYYQDLYGNKYGWFVNRVDRRFTARLVKKNGKVIDRRFAKKKLAINWAWKNYYTHNEKQKQARVSRKARAEARKPKLSEQEKKVKEITDKLAHCVKLSHNTGKKIKALQTRNKKHMKRILYYQKRLADFIKTSEQPTLGNDAQ